MTPNQAHDMLQFMIKTAENRLDAFNIRDEAPPWGLTIRAHTAKRVFTQAQKYLENGHSVDELNHMILKNLGHSLGPCDELVGRYELAAWAELAHEVTAGRFGLKATP